MTCGAVRCEGKTESDWVPRKSKHHKTTDGGLEAAVVMSHMG